MNSMPFSLKAVVNGSQVRDRTETERKRDSVPVCPGFDAAFVSAGQSEAHPIEKGII